MNKPKHNQTTVKNKIRNNLNTFISAILIALGIRVFLIEPYKIPTGSMIPTLIVGDQLLVNKFVYGVRIPVVGWKMPAFMSPGRGDIVVFHYPRYVSPGILWEMLDLFTFGIFGLTNTSDSPKNFIKRVLAMPGDWVRFEDQRFSITATTRQADKDTPLPVLYTNSFSTQKYADILSKLEKIRIPALAYYFPSFISDNDFNKKVLAQLNSEEDRQFLKQFYHFDSFEKGYRLFRYMSDTELEKVDQIFDTIDFPKPFYSQHPSGQYMGYNKKNYITLEVLNVNAPDEYAHLIQTEDPHNSTLIPFLYIPRRQDIIELEVLENNAQQEVLFQVNGKLLATLNTGEYVFVHDKYYSTILPNVLTNPHKKSTHRIEKDYYFVVGDNRDVSSDSREWGFISEDDIIGAPMMIYWPSDRFGRIAR